MARVRPYRKNKILPKVKAERTRLKRVYYSQVPSEVKEQIQHAGRALTRAIKLLQEPQASD